MKMRRCFGLVLALALAVSSLGASVMAAESLDYLDYEEVTTVIPRASGRFSTTISAGTVKKIGDGISMEVGNAVLFNASYSPSSASVDFGLIDSDNVFHYINITDGSINCGISVDKRGTYTPAIRNNSSDPVYVTGILEY